MTSVTNPLSVPTANSTTTQSSPTSGSLDDQNVFLQLLVAQLENQDPENPTDGTTFVTQLAQFSELSNSTQMLSDLNAIQQSAATLAAAVPAASTTSSPNPGTAPTTS
ncbi:MAG TPA: flagellar hook capping FlgD N-terminal domain-containing protein [Bryobacteraceae bacterium]|nr:flagellar hook capping FlgD N-terminal domain-containing protein [Bryobacteraceae bacterium]